MSPMSAYMVVVMMIIIMMVHDEVSASTTEESDSVRLLNESDAKHLIATLTNRSDSRVRPGVFGPPIYVGIDFFVQSFGPLDEMRMEFSTNLDFRGTWMDNRLTFPSDNDDPMYIPNQDTDKFWVPDLYFPNDKSGEVHKVTIPNRSIRIYPDGTVRLFIRMTMTLSCTMYLQKFPLDYQICIIKISTYSYDSKQVVLRWYDDSPIEIHKHDLNLPQFHLEHYYGESCTETYKTGNYSCLQASFFLRRKVGFFILQTYVPSILIVVLSWVGFWINKDSEPARIALGVTTVLTMTTQLTTSRSNTMRVSYLKAIDIWYSACMVFVFAALVEFAFVNASSRFEKKQRLGEQKKFDDIEMQPSNEVTNDQTKKALSQDETPHLGEGSTSPTRSQVSSSGTTVTTRLRNFQKWACGHSKNIDKLSRFAFPAAFIIFNLIYWVSYLLPPHYHCNISSLQVDSCVA